MARLVVVISLALCSVLFSCKKLNLETSAGVKQLTVQLKSQNPGCTCDPHLGKYKWKNQLIYVLLFAGPACNTTPSFYDSNGEPMQLPAGYDFMQFFQDSQFVENVWVCK